MVEPTTCLDLRGALLSSTCLTQTHPPPQRLRPTVRLPLIVGMPHQRTCEKLCDTVPATENESLVLCPRAHGVDASFSVEWCVCAVLSTRSPPSFHLDERP